MKKKKQEQQINYLDLIPVKAEGLKWHKDFRDRVILEVKNGSFSYGQREILRENRHGSGCSGKRAVW